VYICRVQARDVHRELCVYMQSLGKRCTKRAVYVYAESRQEIYIESCVYICRV
jgi:hypothetical protein